MDETTRKRILLAALAGGYLMLLIDTWFSHRTVVHAMWYAWIPPVTSVIMATVLLLAAAVWSTAMARVAAGFLTLSILVGLGGIYFHNRTHFGGHEHGEVLRVMGHGPDAGAPGAPVIDVPPASETVDPEAVAHELRELGSGETHGEQPSHGGGEAEEPAGHEHGGGEQHSSAGGHSETKEIAELQRYPQPMVPPLLAPLTFAGLPVVGVLALWPALKK